jgi:hypothetical protein
MRARLWGCSGGREDFTFWAPGFEYVVETGCHDPQTTNAVRGTYGAVLLRRVDLFDDMSLRVSSNAIGGHGDAVHVLQQCASCLDGGVVMEEITNDPYDYETRFYPRGRYEVLVFFDRRDHVGLSITSEYP